MIIGRDRELAELRRALDRAAADGGAVRVITGEAGVGKSHLLDALIAEARSRGFEPLTGRCFADAVQSAFAPWRAVLPERRRRTARLEPVDERARAFESILQELSARARKRPLLMVIEDLQWADRDSLHMFLHAARFGLKQPLLLAGSVRIPDLDFAMNHELDAVLAELARIPEAQQITLRPFGDEEVAAYAAEVAGGTVPQSITRVLCAATGGNPLYVRELVRHMVEVGKLALEHGRIGTDFAAEELGLPQSLRHVVRRRVARLSEQARALVRVASAASGPLDLGTLARAAAIEPEAALDPLDEAIAAGLVRVAETRYELVHAIVGRAIYEELSPDRRAPAHRRLAEALRAANAPDHAEIASHYHASRHLPGAEDGVPHAITAAEAAIATGAQERAASLFAIAAELSAGPAERSALLGRCAVARAETLDAEGALAALELACRSPAVEPASLLVRLARALERGGTPRPTWEPLLGRARAALGETRDHTWAHVSLLAARPIPVLEGPVWVSRFGGYDPEAVRLLRDSGDEGDFAATVEGHDTRAPAETAALLERTYAWSDPAAIMHVLEACGRDLFFAARELHRATAVLDRLLEIAEREGSMRGRSAALVLLGCCHAVLGDLPRAAEELARARAISARLGAMHRMNRVGPAALETVIAYFERSPAIAPVSTGLLEFISTPRAATVPFGVVALGLALLGAALANDTETAHHLFPLHVRALRAMPVDVPEWGAGRDCGASAAWLLGAHEVAADYLASCEREPERAGAAPWACVEHSEALMAALCGDLERASRGFARARDVYARSGRGPSLAIADHDEALALVRCGRAGEPRAGTLAASAGAAFERLGMSGWVAAARALSAAPADRPAGLSDRELEVLCLLASGLANKEIGAKLFISVPTVERHIANIYKKIGSHGRAAATAYALRHGLLRG